MTKRRILRLASVAVVVALATGSSGAVASSQNSGDYASPERIQLGHGPGGPPTAPAFSVREAASSGGALSDYASPELIQLGHGPGGPPAAE